VARMLRQCLPESADEAGEAGQDPLSAAALLRVGVPGSVDLAPYT
jgi:hypothetical protein